MSLINEFWLEKTGTFYSCYFMMKEAVKVLCLLLIIELAAS